MVQADDLIKSEALAAIHEAAATTSNVTAHAQSYRLAVVSDLVVSARAGGGVSGVAARGLEAHPAVSMAVRLANAKSDFISRLVVE